MIFMKKVYNLYQNNKNNYLKKRNVLCTLRILRFTMSMDPVMRGVNPGKANQPVQNVCESIAIVEAV